ncbi:PREDICTED: baculoviral IAP repeat-containing protein 5 [Nicrophorus vespilloides]|uniref:Baculoviral IAP repeat-containing protein 5 n=1 Tax=Nicrophorus vespilloides TaxID=110193 RepID=A0ABM1MVA8_NICVS|nr:PREDICTED: baculoviral IAP repeat-containing protein 5 [Nicrophorus vespilloides]
MTADLKYHLTMFYEEERLKTFKKWIFKDDEVCNAAKMAEAGFYFIGQKDEPDVVKCFLCNKTLDGWEAQDDPWDEHYKHSKNCTFASMKQPEFALTLDQFLKIRFEQYTQYLKLWNNNLNKHREEELQELRKVIDGLL